MSHLTSPNLLNATMATSAITPTAAALWPPQTLRATPPQVKCAVSYLTPGSSCCWVMSSESSSDPPYTLKRPKEEQILAERPEEPGRRDRRSGTKRDSWQRRCPYSRLAHRRLGVFLHVILAQLLLSLVPAEGEREQRSRKK